MNIIRTMAITAVSVCAAVSAAGQTSVPLPAQNADPKILVAYFSQAGEQYNVGWIEKGNTQIVAEYIAQKTGGALFHIEREKAYSTKHRDLLNESKAEMSRNERPALIGKMPDISQYDVIFLGYPIWWSDLPMPVYTFLKSASFSGKTVIPFCTHEGSGDAGTQQKISTAVKDADVKEVLAIRGKTAQTDSNAVKASVDAWLKKQGKLSIAETGEKQIIAEFEKFQQAMIDKNIDYLRTCLGPDVRHMNGRIQASEDWLNEIKAGVMNYYSYKIKNLKVVISGSTAELDCNTELNAKVYGINGVWTLPSHSMYIKTETGWPMKPAGL